MGTIRLVRNKESSEEFLQLGLENEVETPQCLVFPLGKDDLKVPDGNPSREVIVGRSKLIFPTLIDRLEFVLTLRVLSSQNKATTTTNTGVTSGGGGGGVGGSNNIGNSGSSST